MTRQAESTYAFGPYRIDGVKRLLLRDGEPVPLTPKCFDILLALVESGGDVLEKDRLISGRRGDALKKLNELKGLSRRRYVDPAKIGIIYAALNETDQAFVWLERAFQDRSVWMLYLKVDPKFDRLRADARFEDFMRRVGLPQ